MRNPSTILFLLFTAFSVNAQIISFSDSSFKAKLLQANQSNFIARDLNGDYFAIDANANGEIEVSEALQVGFLQIDNSAISSLNGINNFTNLIELNCESNLITTLNLNGLSALTLLNCSNNLLTDLNVTGLTALQDLNCQFNQLTSLDAGGLVNLTGLNCGYNQISNLNVSGLQELTNLYCNDNALLSFDTSDLIGLTMLDCSYNQLTSISLDSLVNLITLNCASNSLTSLVISNLTNIFSLNCSSNTLTTLTLSNLVSLTELNCNFNQLSFVNLNDLVSLKNFTCTNNELNSLIIDGLSQLENINCANNNIIAVDLSNLSSLISLTCSNNQITSLDASNLTGLKYLYCDNNSIGVLNVDGLNLLQVLSCSNNQINSLSLNTTSALQSLYCFDNNMAQLDLSNLFNFQNLFCANNQLTTLLIKNGSIESNLQFSGNPDLIYICADETEIENVQYEIDNNSYTNCHVNSYCSFVPGGLSYTINGNSKLDSNGNSCDSLDTDFPFLQLSFTDGVVTENLISNTTGNYIKSLRSGFYNITPLLENPNYFSISPAVVTVDFPQAGNSFTQNYCINPNGSHSDVEISILPLNNAIPGQQVTYKIVYKNKGTLTQSGSVRLNFNDVYLDFISSGTAPTSQTVNNLDWIFTNLNPLETRTILVTMSLNSSTASFPVNIGQVLNFTANISIAADEVISNNSINFNQLVTGAVLNNQKVCLQGAVVSSAQIGEYVHYFIHFKNTTSALVQNVVVKDIIDIDKFNISSLVPLHGSHLFETRISNLNTVEFIFENINLGFTNNDSDGYVLFKIKTLPTLSIGDSFSNFATVYFDYKAPVTTNTETTTIQTLLNEGFDSQNKITIHPNPVKEILNIYKDNLSAIHSIKIYNSLGQLIKMIDNPDNHSVNVSSLKSGIYIISITIGNRNNIMKFVKE